MSHAVEQDIRLDILDSFLATPHRQLAELAPLHTRALERDPLFYGHLAVWYLRTGEVRDHKILFVAHLLTGPEAVLREAGWVLLQGLAPFEVARVLNHAKRVVGKTPRSLRSAIAHYLQTREANQRQFDGAAVRAREALKHLYASLHLKPSPRAQASLFANEPPADSPLGAVRRLAQATSPEEQARLIIDHRIPYLTAIGAVSQVTPTLLVALVDRMSPQEVINSLGALKRRGALDHPGLKAMIDEKLAAATTDTRVSTMKAKRAIAAVDLDEATEQRLTEMVDQRVAAKAEIRRPTALFVDKSSSMTEAIAVARELSALISAVVTASFHVYAFDTSAFELRPKGGADRRPAHSDWERAFALVKAEGGTSIGAPLAKMTRDRVAVEQIVIVTDEGENTGPFFHQAYADYQAALHMSPNVVIVQIGTGNERFSDQLRQRGIVLTRHRFSGDYYSLPNILPLLALPSRAELVDSIMALDLPSRPQPATGREAL